MVVIDNNMEYETLRMIDIIREFGLFIGIFGYRFDMVVIRYDFGHNAYT